MPLIPGARRASWVAVCRAIPPGAHYGEVNSARQCMPVAAGAPAESISTEMTSLEVKVAVWVKSVQRSAGPPIVQVTVVLALLLRSVKIQLLPATGAVSTKAWNLETVPLAGISN